MKPTRIFLTLILAVGLGLGAGAMLRRGHTGRISAGRSSSQPQHARMRAGNGVVSGRKAAGDPATCELARKLKQEISTSEGVTRWLYWLEALERAGPVDFPHLARMAEGNPALRKLVGVRWAELYPRQMFDSLVTEIKSGRTYASQDLSLILFQEWPKNDPTAAIAALNEPNDLGSRDAWRHAAVATVFDNDVERGLRLMSEWHVENFAPRMEAAAKWAATDPVHAAEFTLANPTGYASQMMIETIGKEWAKSDPAAALRFGAGKGGEMGLGLAATALNEWAGKNLSEAASALAQTDQRTRNLLSPVIVEQWARQDASSAMEWAEANVSGIDLAEAAGAVVRGAAEKDMASAARLVTDMNPSPARTSGAVALADKWIPNTTEAKPIPSEAIAWMGTLDLDSLRHVIDQVAWKWTESDPKTFAAFLKQVGPDAVPTWVYPMFGRTLAGKDPAAAMQWAAELPEGERLAAGSEAFAEWWLSQSDAANQWLNGVAESDPRRRGYFEAAVRNMIYDSRAAAYLAAMSEPERAIAREVIDGLKLPEERRARLLEAMKTGSSQIPETP